MPDSPPQPEAAPDAPRLPPSRGGREASWVRVRIFEKGSDRPKLAINLLRYVCMAAGQEATRLADRAREWTARDRNSGLLLRGPGEYLGVRQSGAPLLRFADIERDAALIEQAEVRGPITLLMHDWGGMIGMTYALKYPGRLRSLVLCDTSSRLGPEVQPIWDDRIKTASEKGMEPLVEPTSIMSAASASDRAGRTRAEHLHRHLSARLSAARDEDAFVVAILDNLPPAPEHQAAIIAANRSLLATLVATNLLGQNSPTIAATEAQYMQMWAQDAAAMYAYAGSSATGSSAGASVASSG